MNKGISLARGRVLGFFNSDDYYQPAVLPKVLGFFKDLPAPSFLVGIVMSSPMMKRSLILINHHGSLTNI